MQAPMSTTSVLCQPKWHTQLPSERKPSLLPAKASTQPRFQEAGRSKQANSSLLSGHNLLTEHNILKQVKQKQSKTDREGTGRSSHLDLLDELPYISMHLWFCYRISLTEYTACFCQRPI